MQLTNLTHHLLDQHGHDQDARNLATIINQIVIASKIISREVNKAGLVDILGSAGKTNIQDEEVQKLDEYTNTICIELLRQIPQVKAVGSEEMEKMVIFKDHKATAQYVVLLDPLDGSSNIDVNVSIGTIFAIYKKQSKGISFKKSDYLQPGSNLVASGYTLYGSSTMLVYTSGYGLHGFTLDPSIGEFLLSHEHIKFPKMGKYYSINESYTPKWTEGIKKYVDEVKTNKDVTKKPKNARYIGSLVADFHRNLLKGGVFLYPSDKKNPHGKLRLMFEAIPFAFMAEQAGGYASNGTQSILTIEPKELHQRVPLFIGNKADVKRVEKYLK